MEKELQQAFDSLTPKDQHVVAIVLLSLCEKDKQNSEMAAHISKSLFPNRHLESARDDDERRSIDDEEGHLSDVGPF